MLQWIEPETGRRKSKSAETADQKKAEAARGDLEADLNNGRYAEASRMTWERFRELFEEEYVAGCRANTRLIYGNSFDLFEELCQPGKLRSITSRTVSKFAAAMRTRQFWGRDGMLPSTIKVRLQYLHTALAWAVEQKLIPEVPAFPVVKPPKKRPQPVAGESFERLVAKARDDEMRAFLLCGWLAGLRLIEAYSLEWEETAEAPWVDFNRNRIWLPAGFVKATEDQWVPLDPALRSALGALPRRGRYVFPSATPDGKRVTGSAVGRRVIRLAKQAGVKLTMHSLRKGFGCRYAGKVPAQVLQKLMRHSTIAVTMDYYANVDAAVEEAVLGPQRNRSRNTRPGPAHQTARAADANPSPETVSGTGA
jgi:integrase